MAVGIGIELAPGAVRAVLVESAGPQLKLLAAHEAACDTADAEALTASLAHARRTLRLTSPVVLGIPSASAILATVSPLVVNARRADLAVQFELQQQLPFELAHAAWHYYWLASNGHPAHIAPRASNARRALVAAMRRSVLEERVAACRRAGLVVHAVAAAPVAILNAWRALPANARATQATLLHVIDGQSAEWIVWSPAALHVVPVAGSSADLLWEELPASWEALRGQVPDASSQVSVLGTEAAEPSWARAQEALARAGLRGDRFDVAGAFKPGATRLEHPGRAAAACGLALQSLGTARLPLNLLTEAQEAAQADQVRRMALTVSGLCAVAAVGFGVTGMLESRGRRARVLELLERREQLYQTLRPEVRELIQRQQETERRTLQLEQLVRSGPLVTQLLAKVAEILPDGAWLTSAAYSKSGLLVEGMLEGRARSFQDVTKLFDQLKVAAGMTTVKPLSTSVTTDPDTGKELIVFSVQVQRPLHMTDTSHQDTTSPSHPKRP
ncbi:MAG: PilN domain-containing protein [Candidatus Omnitrophica bacterium]|nr:PilN domain-containing protein [Candidatus Omnitrophota bacterium]